MEDFKLRSKMDSLKYKEPKRKIILNMFKAFFVGGIICSIGETIFVWLILLYPLTQFSICYVGVNINSILLSFKEYVLIDLPDGSVKYEWLWLNGERFFENFAMFIKDIAEEEKMGMLMKNSIIQYLVCLLIGMPLNIIFAYIIYKKILFFP